MFIGAGRHKFAPWQENVVIQVDEVEATKDPANINFSTFLFSYLSTNAMFSFSLLLFRVSVPL